jgi:hypothetical protein
MNDSNVVVVILAANCIERLAAGLASMFNPYRSMVKTFNISHSRKPLICCGSGIVPNGGKTKRKEVQRR